LIDSSPSGVRIALIVVLFILSRRLSQPLKTALISNNPKSITPAQWTYPLLKPKDVDPLHQRNATIVLQTAYASFAVVQPICVVLAPLNGWIFPVVNEWARKPIDCSPFALAYRSTALFFIYLAFLVFA
jgi:hypothetical protein